MTRSRTPSRTSPRPRPEARDRARATGGERLQKVLAAAGVASRRAAEDLIRGGRVQVNGRVVRELGVRVDPARDRIAVDGERVGRPARPRYFVIHKPRGVVTTTRDPEGKRTVLDLIPSRERLFPVGRLDAASEGLLLVTNDGALAQVMLHPSFEVPRTYKVSVDGFVEAEALRRLSRGIEMDATVTAPCEVRILAREENRTVLEIVLVEGRRRQIRRMMEAVGHPVRRLVRTQFGPLRLGGLRSGESRPLSASESEALERMVAQPPRAVRRPPRRAEPREEGGE